MKSELLMVTEIEFSGSERITRYEFRKGNGYAGEEWTRARPGGPWRPTKNKVSSRRLDIGLSVYQRLCCEHTEPAWKARLRGIAVSNSVSAYTEGRLMRAASNLLFLWLEGTSWVRPTVVRRRGPTTAGQTLACYHFVIQPPSEILIAFHARFVRFHEQFPRGITGEGCWAVQV